MACYICMPGVVCNITEAATEQAMW